MDELDWDPLEELHLAAERKAHDIRERLAAATTPAAEREVYESVTSSLPPTLCKDAAGWVRDTAAAFSIHAESAAPPSFALLDAFRLDEPRQRWAIARFHLYLARAFKPVCDPKVCPVMATDRLRDEYIPSKLFLPPPDVRLVWRALTIRTRLLHTFVDGGSRVGRLFSYFMRGQEPVGDDANTRERVDRAQEQWQELTNEPWDILSSSIVPPTPLDESGTAELGYECGVLPAHLRTDLAWLKKLVRRFGREALQEAFTEERLPAYRKWLVDTNVAAHKDMRMSATKGERQAVEIDDDFSIRVCTLAWGITCAPPIDVDVLWHTHLLYGQKYIEWCKDTFAQLLHHRPKMDGIDDLSRYFAYTDAHGVTWQAADVPDLLANSVSTLLLCMRVHDELELPTELRLLLALTILGDARWWEQEMVSGMSVPYRKWCYETEEDVFATFCGLASSESVDE
eukprot:TRINITY_DN7082_c0_g1_i4.p1 TRINITY_DN7082_c0_g1~~TRINITY_DN7082_c0_g1_i4.p1  ORF type:complete len:455 (-),score=112.34 TRINITY_DN7082_c0_g1_i4:244-1608(-)